MNDTTWCWGIRQSLGVYVLGAIDPAERADVDAHLAGCPGCRDELAGLAGLPALLRRVPAAEAARIAARGLDHERLAPGGHEGGEADGALTPLLRRMAHRRRVTRWRAAAAAAAVLIIAAGSAIGASALSGPAAGPAADLHWDHTAGTNAATQARADIKYAATSSGTEVEVRVRGIPAGTTCQFWVLGAGGQRWAAGSWTEPEGGRSQWFQSISAAPVGVVRGFQIASGHTVLVSVKA